MRHGSSWVDMYLEMSVLLRSSDDHLSRCFCSYFLNRYVSFGNVELVLAPRAKLHFAIHGISLTLTTEKLSRLLFEEGHTEFCSFGLKDSIFLSETGCPSCQKCPTLLNRIFQMAAEARRQYYAGETEEGGFAVE